MSNTLVVHIGNNEALDRFIQEELFKAGYEWVMGGKTLFDYHLHGNDYHICIDDQNKRLSYIAYMGSESHEIITIPELLKRLATPDIKVKLNATYTATVTKDHVKVGCQTFSHEAIRDLSYAVNKIKNIQ